MNRPASLQKIRNSLVAGKSSVGSWMQIPNASVAEILGDSNFDWIAVDLEHGSISVSQLPDVFRALELGGTLPLVRLREGSASECKAVLDAGAGGVIVPMVETASQLITVRDSCRWPPAGKRGVAFSRANLFGKNFGSYADEAQRPFLCAMIESLNGLSGLDDILTVEGLDAIFIGPYDLSASMGCIGEFDRPEFVDAMEDIRSKAKAAKVPAGLHVVAPDRDELARRLAEGYQFVAYSIDTVMLRAAVEV